MVIAAELVISTMQLVAVALALCPPPMSYMTATEGEMQK